MFNNINAVPEVLTSKAIIRFQDCDPYSHLNNGRYLDYFMNAREDMVWKAYDFNIYEYSRTTGLGWVVTQNCLSQASTADGRSHHGKSVDGIKTQIYPGRDAHAGFGSKIKVIALGAVYTR